MTSGCEETREASCAKNGDWQRAAGWEARFWVGGRGSTRQRPGKKLDHGVLRRRGDRRQQVDGPLKQKQRSGKDVNDHRGMGTPLTLHHKQGKKKVEGGKNKGVKNIKPEKCGDWKAEVGGGTPTGFWAKTEAYLNGEANNNSFVTQGRGNQSVWNGFLVGGGGGGGGLDTSSKGGGVVLSKKKKKKKNKTRCYTKRSPLGNKPLKMMNEKNNGKGTVGVWKWCQVTKTKGNLSLVKSNKRPPSGAVC